MKLRLLTNVKSKSLRLVAEEIGDRLGYKVFRRPTEYPNRVHARYGHLINKLEQYEYFKKNKISSLDFTTNREEARKWVTPATPVFARTLLNSSEGKGIVVCETPGEVPVAPVYTKYQKKKQEFRVHIFKGEVVSVVEKRKRLNWTKPSDPRIRNTANGFVFCHDDVVEPAGIRDLALKASKVTNSDFKGVDIGYNQQKKQLFVIEVNSAPGIEGTNVKLYADCIIKNLKLTKMPGKPVAAKKMVVAKKVAAKKKVAPKVKEIGPNDWPF